MACCYSEVCGENAVTPIFISPCIPTRYCDETPAYYPCLPKCTKPKVTSCCEKRPVRPRSPHCCEQNYECDERPCKTYRKHCSRHTPRCASPDMSPEPCPTCCTPVKTKYVIPCYRYEDGRIVKKLPISAFKRNGMQDQEHSKLLGTTNFLVRHPQDVLVECDICTQPVKFSDPARVPKCITRPVLDSCLLKKKPIEVSLEDLLDD